MRHGFFLDARTLRALLLGNRCPRRLLPRMLFSAREHLASPWLDLAEDRLRLDRLSRNAVGSTFFPWASHPAGQAPRGPRFAHSSRSKKASPREGGGLTADILRCAPALRPPHRTGAMGTPTGGCVVDRPRPADRHRGRGGRGHENSKEKRYGQHRFLQEGRQ